MEVIMRKDEFEIIKRKMFLEEKIKELKEEYPNFKQLEYEQILFFIANKMNSEKEECLSYNDWQYFNKACFLLFEEIFYKMNLAIFMIRFGCGIFSDFF